MYVDRFACSSPQICQAAAPKFSTNGTSTTNSVKATRTSTPAATFPGSGLGKSLYTTSTSLRQ